MTFDELYTKALKTWPSEIDISDGYIAGNGGYLFPKLNLIYDQIDEMIDPKTDHWGMIASWSLCQAIHEYAIEMLKNNKEVLIVKNVDKEVIDRCIRGNLEDQEWEEERKNYKGLA